MQKQSLSQGFRKFIYLKTKKISIIYREAVHFLNPFATKVNSGSYAKVNRGLHLWNTIVIRQNIDLEQSTGHKICKVKIKVYLFSLYGVSF